MGDQWLELCALCGNQVCGCGHNFQQIGREPGMVANPAHGHLTKGKKIFPVPFAPEKFGLAS